MSIHVALNHVTEYRYDRRVGLSPQVVRLRPAPHCRTPILSYSLRSSPSGHFINWQQDPFANYLARLVFPEKTDRFRVTVDLVAEMSVYNPFDFFLEPAAEKYPFSYEASLRHDLAPYLARDALTPRLRDFLQSIDTSEQRTIDFLVTLNQRLQRDIRYLIRMEPGVQTPEQTLALAAGSCRDTGWLLVQALRHLGLAARFVSGYLIQLKPDVKSLDGPSGRGARLHRPARVVRGVPAGRRLDRAGSDLGIAGRRRAHPGGLYAGAVERGAGQRRGRRVRGRVLARDESDAHLRIAARDPSRIRTSSGAQIVAVGRKVDASLRDGDVRLTMGGEPTFVSVDDRDGAEWNTAALGPTKRGYATELVQRLREKYGRGGFLHFGQGKWYPGEQLPRWALSVLWRADGEPCWNEPSRFADEREPTSYTVRDGRRFIEGLTQRLGLEKKFIQTGFEDTWYYLWRERRLPVNVDPFDSKLDDELERARLRRVFDQGLDNEVGYVLPLGRVPRAGPAGPGWISGPWFFRDGRMYLMPGDSPMGYRLPLDSLPWVSKGDYPYLHEHDPFAHRAPLPLHADVRARYAPHAVGGGFAEGGAVAMQAGFEGAAAIEGAGSGVARAAEADLARVPARFESAHWIARTALCVEVRSGVLYVFMPPLAQLGDYLDLLAAVEATAGDLEMKLVLEGYPPPRDPRLTHAAGHAGSGRHRGQHPPGARLGRTGRPHRVPVRRGVPDPPVDREVHARRPPHRHRRRQPLRARRRDAGRLAVPAPARPARQPDCVLAQPSVAVVPVLGAVHRPDEPGAARGRGAQRPALRTGNRARRVVAHREDESARGGADAPPWLVDRALRNILIDVTGNTHRAEFCIDKLYSPDGPTGRLGLLELRAFEMPPHARMSLAQQLLLRALVARFWHEPYTGRLTRWGTELHDRFLLPTFVWMDFEDVLGELNEAGYAFDTAWFAPHFEFRFPLFGEVAARGIHLALRGALEPWHVMGEEGAAGATVRYVDSSLERIEVRASGLNESRYVITVNGQAIALQPTGRAGEYVAGVRYRAWQPAAALHPSIGVHAPLTFDIVDTWNSRSLGGCQYHVAHPGGRNYEVFPVNAYEAESRRLARFFRIGHTAGRMDVRHAQPSREFPFTLDLRRT